MIKIKDKDESSAQNKLDEKAYWLINNLKEQWLEFLIECNSQTTTPDRNKQHSDETDSQIMEGMELEYLNEDHI